MSDLETLQQLYEQDKRRQAEIEVEDRTTCNKTLSVFTQFRKSNPSHTLETFSMGSSGDTYRDFKEKEIDRQRQKLELLQYRLAYEAFFLQWERRESNQKSNDATRYRADEIARLKDEVAQLIQSSPEAWQAYYETIWFKDIDCFSTQKLVPVPYVERTKQKIIESLELGHPVYLVGHLGSGKTQLAIETAVEFSIKHRVQDELEESLNHWFLANIHVSEEDVFDMFCKLHQERREYYTTILESGTKEDITRLQPLFISGSHNLTYEDMFVEKTLSLEQQFTSDSFNDYLDRMVDDYNQWMTEHQDYLAHISSEEQLQLRVQIWKSFSDLLIAKNNTFGTTIKKIERELLIAIKEGRPVIIDELNTIAMQHLIALNDILQRHAGQTAYITGVGPVYIQPGFAFIGTGNLSTQQINYEGTNQLNPAFQSRFVTIEYNYVPQSMIGDVSRQSKPQESELFRVILSTLSFENGCVQLPNVEHSLEELFRFAQLCKLTQDVFIGKWVDDTEEDGFQPLELRESVLSIRNMMHVLESWNLGEEKDLSQALWDSFISSITYPEDQVYIMGQAVRYGFFKESDGWTVTHSGMGLALMTYDDIRAYPYRYTRGAIGTLSSLDVIHLLFGKEPERQMIPDQLAAYDETKETIFHLDTYEKNFDIIRQLDYTQYLLDYLDELGEDK